MTVRKRSGWLGRTEAVRKRQRRGSKYAKQKRDPSPKLPADRHKRQSLGFFRPANIHQSSGGVSSCSCGLRAGLSNVILGCRFGRRACTRLSTAVFSRRAAGIHWRAVGRTCFFFTVIVALRCFCRCFWMGFSFVLTHLHTRHCVLGE